jgi:hypothetical protein
VTAVIPGIDLSRSHRCSLAEGHGNAPRVLSRDVGSAREQRRCVRVAINEKPRPAPGLLHFCATLPVANCHSYALVVPKADVILTLRGARQG